MRHELANNTCHSTVHNGRPMPTAADAMGPPDYSSSGDCSSQVYHLAYDTPQPTEPNTPGSTNNLEPIEPTSVDTSLTDPTATNSSNGDSVLSVFPTMTETSMPGVMRGRNFDDDLDNTDLRIRDELSELSRRFEKASLVLNSPARFGVFLNYLFNQNHDVAPALFYVVNQYFERCLQESKELLKDQKRVSLEIYSTFLHEKSPLRLDIPTQTVVSTLANMQNAVGYSTFTEASQTAFIIVQRQLSGLVCEIQLGLDTWKPPKSVNMLIQRSREEEMTIFEMCLTPHLQTLASQMSTPGPRTSADQPPVPGTSRLPFTPDASHAIYISLLTAYRCFASGGAYGPEAGDTTGFSGSLARSGLTFKSTENLNASTSTSTGVNLWTKPVYFCAKHKQKSHGHLFGSRKPKIVHKNHSLQEKAFERLEECFGCGQLLWGLSPQGLGCNNCELSVHHKCKPAIRDSCSKEGRRSLLFNQSFSSGAQTPDALPSIPPDVSGFATYAGHTSRRHRTRGRFSRHIDDFLHMRNSFRDSTASLDTGLPKSVSSLISASMDLALVPDGQSTNAQNAVVCPPSIESSPYTSRKSVSVIPENASTAAEGSTERTARENGANRVSMMKSQFEKKPENQSPHVFRSNSVMTPQPKFAHGSVDSPTPPGGSSDTVPDLVSNDWSNDPEMLAGESFEAAAELKHHFPSYQIPAKGSKNEDYVRMLCLLEFHQKVQFVVRSLKLYDYLLLSSWPSEHKYIYYLLCLDQISILIELFRGLVARIESTKTPQGYVGMAEAVLSWLTDNSNANLEAWARHSQALSCTNMLDCVNKTVSDYAQRRPDVLRLLQLKYQKNVLLDGLKQQRILYINLPLIASNIVKDLDKKTKSYRDEAKVWKEIYKALSSLPSTIDNVCMPLVRRINKGQLQSGLDKKDSLFRHLDPTIKHYEDLLLHFPQSLFRYWVVLHAEVAVDRLTVTSANKVNYDYIRERTPMLVILLRDALLLLVKDGDRFVLKPFKSAREHASGSLTSNLPERSSNSFLQAVERPSFSHHTSFSTSAGPHSNGSLTSGPGSQSRTIAPGSSSLVSNVASIAGSTLSDKPASSGGLKIAPILSVRNMYTSSGEKIRDESLLNIVSMDPTVLIRLLFNDESQLNQLSKALKERSSQSANRIMSVQQQKQLLSTPLVHPIKPTLSSEEPQKLEPAEQSTVVGVFNSETQDQKNLPSPIVIRPSPFDELIILVRKCNRMSIRMRETLHEALHISAADHANDSALAHSVSVANMPQLLLAQVNLTEKWLDCLARSVSLMISLQNKHASTLSTVLSESSLSGSPLVRKLIKRNESLRENEEAHRTSSTPNLHIHDELNEGVLPDGKPLQLNVQDHRRLRVQRSVSALTFPTKPHQRAQLFLQTEMLASQMVDAMRRLAALHEEHGDPGAESETTDSFCHGSQQTDSLHSSGEEDNNESTNFETSETEDEADVLKVNEQCPVLQPAQTLDAESDMAGARQSQCPENDRQANVQRSFEDHEDQITPTATEVSNEIDSLFAYSLADPAAQGGPTVEEASTGNIPVPPSSVSIDRNNSQKSTSSSGFVEY